MTRLYAEKEEEKTFIRYIAEVFVEKLDISVNNL